MVGKGFAKGFGERQGRGSLASHLRFACEIGAVLSVFSQERRISLARSLINRIVIGILDFDSRIIDFIRVSSSAIESIFYDLYDLE
jgi:hypothetical protein